MSLTYKQLLGGNANFRFLFFGQVVSELGNWFNFIAGLGLVRVASHAAPEAAAIILLVRTAPFAVIAPFAGALVDRLSRKNVMIVMDLLRVFVALGFLLVKTENDLWIAYLCTALLSVSGSFFEAAKNAAMPNVTGADGLLAGNALMFSSRFLLMMLGAGLGGWAAVIFGYEIAFVINAASFVASAVSIWLIPAGEMQANRGEDLESAIGKSGAKSGAKSVSSVWRDISDGWRFVRSHSLVFTILAVNAVWAIGGGAINLIAERLGSIVFVGQYNLSADAAVSVIYMASGAGLFVGMMITRGVGDFVIKRRLIVPFVGATLIAQGAFYAAAGLVPSLWQAAVLLIISRALLGVEYGVQETILQRLTPDNLRGRVLTLDRALEISIFSLSNSLSGWSLNFISIQLLTVVSGLLSSSAGLFWLWRVRGGETAAEVEFTNETIDDAQIVAAG